MSRISIEQLKEFSNLNNTPVTSMHDIFNNALEIQNSQDSESKLLAIFWSLRRTDSVSDSHCAPAGAESNFCNPSKHSGWYGNVSLIYSDRSSSSRLANTPVHLGTGGYGLYSVTGGSGGSLTLVPEFNMLSGVRRQVVTSTDKKEYRKEFSKFLSDEQIKTIETLYPLSYVASIFLSDFPDIDEEQHYVLEHLKNTLEGNSQFQKFYTGFVAVDKFRNLLDSIRQNMLISDSAKGLALSHE